MSYEQDQARTIHTGCGVKMVQFGCVLPQESATYGTIRDVALECERLGFDSIWLYDHVFPFWKRPEEPILECWTTLSALASQTKTVRLGTIVLSNTFRYPSILAKMAATLDVISNGRLEFGIGAGVCEREHRAYGIPFEDPLGRIDRLREAVHIIKMMWAGDKCTHKGKYYTVEEAVINPGPVQKPHPTLWVGGIGKRLLKVVAECADGCNFWGLDPVEFERRSSVLDDYCRSAGRAQAEVRRSWGGELLIGDSKKEVDKKIERFKPGDLTIDQYVNSSIVGTPKECVERINRYVRLGSEHFMLYFPDATEGTSLELFADGVIGEIED